ncbi:MAG: hypothetical protein M3340_09290 [Actinomycetota bacterium]|nr:hypothetical protein [Actinomycetota bacterium]
MRTRALASLIAGVVLLAGAAPAAAEGPPAVRAKSSKTVVRAALVSWCWLDGERGVCGDGVYRHTERALPYKPRAPLVFGTSFPVEGLSACLMRIGDDGRVAPLGVCLPLTRGEDAKWRGQMPKNLRGANSLWVHVDGPGSNGAEYAVSVRR